MIVDAFSWTTIGVKITCIFEVVLVKGIHGVYLLKTMSTVESDGWSKVNHGGREHVTPAIVHWRISNQEEPLSLFHAAHPLRVTLVHQMSNITMNK